MRLPHEFRATVGVVTAELFLVCSDRLRWRAWGIDTSVSPSMARHRNEHCGMGNKIMA